jgi:hypothetical protein
VFLVQVVFLENLAHIRAFISFKWCYVDMFGGFADQRRLKLVTNWLSASSLERGWSTHLGPYLTAWLPAA